MQIKRDFMLEPNLMLYLPLYEVDGASFMSRDACGHRCTVTGATWTLTGRSFDGADDYVNCGNDPSLNPTNAISIEYWGNNTHTADVKFLLSKGPRDGTYAGPYSIRADVGYYELHLNSNAKVLAISGLATKKFYHIVFTYDRVNVLGYCNGVQKASAAYTTAIAGDTNSLYLGIGYQMDAGVRYFKGLIGELRIYNRALSVLEIQQNYLATKWRYQ